MTGGGISKRRLYTDDEEVILRFLRLVGLNGINPVATRPDLLDRSMIFTLERIGPRRRVPEQALWSEFDLARPSILAGMLDVLSRASRIIRGVEIRDLPRMADFCRWGFAVAESIGSDGRSFLDAYQANIDKQNELAIDSHPVV